MVLETHKLWVIRCVDVVLYTLIDWSPYAAHVWHLILAVVCVGVTAK